MNKNLFNPNATTSMYHISRETSSSLFPDHELIGNPDWDVLNNINGGKLNPQVVEQETRINNMSSYVDINPLNTRPMINMKFITQSLLKPMNDISCKKPSLRNAIMRIIELTR